MAFGFIPNSTGYFVTKKHLVIPEMMAYARNSDVTTPDPGVTTPDPGVTTPDPGMTTPPPVTLERIESNSPARLEVIAHGDTNVTGIFHLLVTVAWSALDNGDLVSFRNMEATKLVAGANLMAGPPVPVEETAVKAVYDQNYIHLHYEEVFGNGQIEIKAIYEGTTPEPVYARSSSQWVKID